jgi:hypothetical protein
MVRIRKIYKPRSYICHFGFCEKACKSHAGLTNHINSRHPALSHPNEDLDIEAEQNYYDFRDNDNINGNEFDEGNEPGEGNVAALQRTVYHPILDGKCLSDPEQSLATYFSTGTPCNAGGVDLAPDTPPPPCVVPCADDFAPYDSRVEFEIADFLFRRNQMPGTDIDELMDLWNTFHPVEDPPFAGHDDLYDTIDSTLLGDVPWESFSVKYLGTIPDTNVPPWMLASYDVWFRDPQKILDNQLCNPDFNHEIDYAAKQVFGEDGQRKYQDLMSGQWAWNQSVNNLQIDCALTHLSAV